MSLSGWVAISCWAILAVLIFGAAAVMVWRDWRSRSRTSLARVAAIYVEMGVMSINEARVMLGMPQLRRLDFRDWLDDWDEVWR